MCYENVLVWCFAVFSLPIPETPDAEDCAMHIVALFALAIPLLATASAQNSPISASARAGIDAGNRAWIAGMKAGNVAPIFATYANSGVDCPPAGGCIEGRANIELHVRSQIAKLGRARSAAVSSWGSTQQGDFVYEWGQAEAMFDNGRKLVDKYLTVWQQQPDGGWKIFRNMVIAEK
jgi:ketosteroid isomerase-like protein